MNIEYALYIIESTNYYSCFTNEEQDEAFEMAYKALTIIRDHKLCLKNLNRMKGDHIAQITANIFKDEIDKLERSGDNGK